MTFCWPLLANVERKAALEIGSTMVNVKHRWRGITFFICRLKTPSAPTMWQRSSSWLFGWTSCRWFWEGPTTRPSLLPSHSSMPTTSPRPWSWPRSCKGCLSQRRNTLNTSDGNPTIGLRSRQTGYKGWGAAFARLWMSPGLWIVTTTWQLGGGGEENAKCNQILKLFPFSSPLRKPLVPPCLTACAKNLDQCKYTIIHNRTTSYSANYT